MPATQKLLPSEQIQAACIILAEEYTVGESQLSQILGVFEAHICYLVRKKKWIKEDFIKTINFCISPSTTADEFLEFRKHWQGYFYRNHKLFEIYNILKSIHFMAVGDNEFYGRESPLLKGEALTTFKQEVQKRMLEYFEAIKSLLDSDLVEQALTSASASPDQSSAIANQETKANLTANGKPFKRPSKVRFSDEVSSPSSRLGCG